MSRRRLDSLRRLVRVVDFLYRQQLVEVGLLRAERERSQSEAEAALGYLDRNGELPPLMATMALARASRAGKSAHETGLRLDARLDLASAALVNLEGLEGRLVMENQQALRALATKELDEALDVMRVGARQAPGKSEPVICSQDRPDEPVVRSIGRN